MKLLKKQFKLNKLMDVSPSEIKVKGQWESGDKAVKKAVFKLRKTLAPTPPAPPKEPPPLSRKDPDDMRGEHNRGKSEHMRKVRAMRQFYHKRMPKLNCNACPISQNCAYYKQGYECYYIKFLQSHKVENLDDMMFYLQQLATASIRRVHWNLIAEATTGSLPSSEGTEQLILASQQLMKMVEMVQSNQGVKVSVSGDVSILERLFGNLDSISKRTEKHLNTPLDVPVVTLEETQETKSESSLMLPPVAEDVLLDYTRRQMEANPVVVNIKKENL